MNLTDYIKKVGPAQFSKEVEVSISAAYMYERGERTPKPEIAQRIVLRTPVTWEGIYGSQKRPA